MSQPIQSVLSTDRVNEAALVSVIIPAYNVSRTIVTCIQSVLKQSYTNTEVIVINDGSVDETEEYCHEIMEKHSNVSLINQRNKGVATARNVGIDHARGQYLMFLDADDTLKANAIQVLTNAAEKTAADIVSFNYSVWRGPQQISRSLVTMRDYPQIKSSDGRTCLHEMYDERISNFTWSFLYRVSFLKSSGINFDSDVYVLEDALFLNALLRKTDKVLYCQEPLYNYNVGISNSLTTGKDNNKVVSGLKAIKGIIALNRKDDSLERAGSHILKLLLFLDHLVSNSDPASKNVRTRIDKEIEDLVKEVGLSSFSLNLKIKIILIKIGLFRNLKSVKLTMANWLRLGWFDREID